MRWVVFQEHDGQLFVRAEFHATPSKAWAEDLARDFDRCPPIARSDAEMDPRYAEALRQWDAREDSIGDRWAEDEEMAFRLDMVEEAHRGEQWSK